MSSKKPFCQIPSISETTLHPKFGKLFFYFYLFIFFSSGLFPPINHPVAAQETSASLKESAHTLQGCSSYHKAEFGQLIQGVIAVNEFTQYKYDYKPARSKLINLNLESNGTAEFPTFFVAQMGKHLSSIDLPLLVEARNQYQQLSMLCAYKNISLSLCYSMDSFEAGSGWHADIAKNASLFFSLNGQYSNNYSFVVSEKHPILTLNQPVSLTLRMQDKAVFYYRVDLNSHLDGLVFSISSDSDILATASLAPSCMAYNVPKSTFFYGLKQTFSRKSVLTVEREKFSSVHLYLNIVVIPGHQGNCFGTKNMTITVTQMQPISQYILPCLYAFLFFSAFFFIAAVYHQINLRMRTAQIDHLLSLGEKQPMLPASISESHPLINPLPPSPASTSILSTTSTSTNTNTNTNSVAASTDLHQTAASSPSNCPLYQGCSSSLHPNDSLLSLASETQEGTSRLRARTESHDSTGYDRLDDLMDEKYIVRSHKNLRVSHLSRKDLKAYEKKIRHYCSSIIILSIFYFLPAIQLVLTYQQRFFSGEEDLCFFNFECSRPLIWMQQFNNVYSNLGYVMMGTLFLILVRLRSLHHQELLRIFIDYKIPNNFTKGLPKHFSLYYAVGLALVCEGVFSATYHLCPTKDNFQFDTSFMYMIAGLLILAMYQKRHPDITSNPHTAYGFFAAVIFCNFLGVFFDNRIFWAFIFLCFGIAACYFTAQIYFLGLWKLNRSVLERVYTRLRSDPLAYDDRLLFLVVANLMNWSLFIYGIYAAPVFSVFLL